MMKRKNFLWATLLLSICLTACNGGGNSSISDLNSSSDMCLHTYTEMTTVKNPTCYEAGLRQNVCLDCDKVIGELSIPKRTHQYSTVEEESVEATCTTAGKNVKKCVYCGDIQSKDLSALSHQFGEHKSQDAMKELNFSENKIYFYKSCTHCDIKNDEVFSVNIEAEENYIPISPTVTMYETAETLSYGFTWNCRAYPLDMELQITKKGSDDWKAYDATVEERYSYADNRSTKISIYVCKAVVELEPSTEYTYKLKETIMEVESDTFEFTSVNPNATSFTFASFSDSQNGKAGFSSADYAPDDGALWNKVLQKVHKVDFYVHTGDICQTSGVEANWDRMLNDNRQYFASTPMMVTPGNHDSEDNYSNGVSSIYNHFNNKIPNGSLPYAKTSTNYYHSFTYANAKFIMLNTNDDVGTGVNQLTEGQLNWLKSELQNNTARWTIVVMHNPLYSVGSWGSNKNTEALNLRKQVGDLFVEYGVDLVIQGHDHEYFKTYPIGVGQEIIKPERERIKGVYYDKNPGAPIYIMSGATGNQNRAPDSNMESKWYDWYASSTKQYSWAEYEVTDTTLKVSVKYLNGDTAILTRDYGIMKTA